VENRAGLRTGAAILTAVNLAFAALPLLLSSIALRRRLSE
jgi:hypothetical protein